MASTVKIVVFDWGGVILRICRSWEEGCQRAGLSVRNGPMDQDFDAARQRISHDYQIGEIECSEFCASLSDAMNGLYTPDELRQIHDAWLIEEYPGVSKLLRTLTEMSSFTTGLLSNTNHLHWTQHLGPDEGGTARFPTARLLEHRHASHVLGVAKPDPQIYQQYEVETGFAGNEILFFDDLTENIASAQAREWLAVQIDHEGCPATQIHDALRAHELL